MISYAEKYGLGVCHRISQKLGIKLIYLRLYFFYFSILTLLIGFILYLILAISFKIKDLIVHKKKTPFDL